MKKSYLYITIIILIIALLCSMKSCSNIKDKNSSLEHNIKALTNEANIYKTKNGELATEKEIFISRINGLQELNDSLYREIKNIKRDINNAVITTITIHDTLHSEQVVYLTKDTSFTFNFSDEWLTFNHNMSLTNNILKSESFDYGMKLNVGVYFTDDNTVVLKSDNPHVVFSNITGWTPTDKKPRTKHWGIGIQLGYGICYNNAFVLTPYLGFGISYNLLTF